MKRRSRRRRTTTTTRRPAGRGPQACSSRGLLAPQNRKCPSSVPVELRLAYHLIVLSHQQKDHRTFSSIPSPSSPSTSSPSPPSFPSDEVPRHPLRHRSCPSATIFLSTIPHWILARHPCARLIINSGSSLSSPRTHYPSAFSLDCNCTIVTIAVAVSYGPSRIAPNRRPVSLDHCPL